VVSAAAVPEAEVDPSAVAAAMPDTGSAASRALVLLVVAGLAARHQGPE
jgi:hypothetical protein